MAQLPTEPLRCVTQSLALPLPPFVLEKSLCLQPGVLRSLRAGGAQDREDEQVDGCANILIVKYQHSH